MGKHTVVRSKEHINKIIATRMLNNSYKTCWDNTAREKARISKLNKPTRYWLGKKRPEMKYVKGWNHTGEAQSMERKNKQKNRCRTPEGREIQRINGMKAKHNKVSNAELIVKENLDKNKIDYIQQWGYKYGVADFYLPKYNLVLECYGEYWHSKPDYIERDKRKNQWLNDNGYKVMIINSEKINELRIKNLI